MRPNDSCTNGIQISMARFSDIVINHEDSTVEVGAGCLWDQVYNKLARHGKGLNIIGGAAREGVGVAGWLLGGGYSLKSNRYGLGIDNIAAYEVVTPNGQIFKVSEGDLYQALRVRELPIFHSSHFDDRTLRAVGTTLGLLRNSLFGRTLKKIRG